MKNATSDQLLFISYFVFRRQRTEFFLFKKIVKWKKVKITDMILQRLQVLCRFDCIDVFWNKTLPDMNWYFKLSFMIVKKIFCIIIDYAYWIRQHEGFGPIVSRGKTVWKTCLIQYQPKIPFNHLTKFCWSKPKKTIFRWNYILFTSINYHNWIKLCLKRGFLGTLVPDSRVGAWPRYYTLLKIKNCGLGSRIGNVVNV